MLTSSFIFAQGITEDAERSIWGRGVTTWDLLRKHRGEAAEAIGESRSKKLLEAVNQAQEALDKKDHHWFAQNWPSKESWRLYKGYCEQREIALVDIETTGRTPGYDQITVIGLSNGTNEYAFVADRPLPGDDKLQNYIEAIKTYELIITYNGISFDIPFIEKHFRDSSYQLNQPHIDLMWPARSLGLSGGLKDMEKQIGIERTGEIADIRGHEAITLWGQWKNSGDRNAYEKLVSYCKADCTNLQAFAEYVYTKKWAAAYGAHASDIDLDAISGEQLSLF